MNEMTLHMFIIIYLFITKLHYFPKGGPLFPAAIYAILRGTVSNKR